MYVMPKKATGRKDIRLAHEQAHVDVLYEAASVGHRGYPTFATALMAAAYMSLVKSGYPRGSCSSVFLYEPTFTGWCDGLGLVIQTSGLISWTYNRCHGVGRLHACTGRLQN